MPYAAIVEARKDAEAELGTLRTVMRRRQRRAEQGHVEPTYKAVVDARRDAEAQMGVLHELRSRTKTQRTGACSNPMREKYRHGEF